MRKLLSTLMVMMTMLTVQANNKSYTYLTFETTDGAKASIEMASLKLTFIGTTLTIGTESFPISNLKKIYTLHLLTNQALLALNLSKLQQSMNRLPSMTSKATKSQRGR